MNSCPSSLVEDYPVFNVVDKAGESTSLRLMSIFDCIHMSHYDSFLGRVVVQLPVLSSWPWNPRLASQRRSIIYNNLTEGACAKLILVGRENMSLSQRANPSVPSAGTVSHTSLISTCVPICHGRNPLATTVYALDTMPVIFNPSLATCRHYCC